MVKEILCALLEHGYSQCTYSPQEIFRQQKMHWQFRIELVKHMLSNAWQQQWGIVPVPDLVECPLHLVDKHFIGLILGQEGGRRKHPSHACFVYNVSKEALPDAGFGTVTNSKSTPLTGVQYAIVHCVLILVLVYIALKRTTWVK